MTMTNRKTQQQPPKPAPKKKATKAQEAETPVNQQTTTETPELQEAPAASAAFSEDEINEISAETDIEPEELEPPVDDDNSVGSSDGDNDDGLPATDGNSDTGASGDSGEASEPVPESAPDILTPQMEVQAKDKFFKVLNGGLDIANGRLTKNDPFGKFKSLDMNGNLEVYRPFSDQIFDRLCDVPLFKRWLYAFKESVLAEKYGAIMMGAYVMWHGIQHESSQRIKVLKEMNAAKERGEEAIKAADNDNDNLKEKAS